MISRSLRYPRLLALGAGALTTLAFAWFNLWPLALAGPALLFFLWSRPGGRGFATGYAYGLGLMGSGVSWLYVSIAQFGDLGWLFPLAITFGFVALMALYYGLLGWLAQRFTAPALPRLLLIFPALWVVLEWLRGWFLSGFPWLQLGYSQIDAPLAGYAPVLGVLGISWLLALSAALLLLLFRRGGVRWGALAGLALIWGAGWGVGQRDWSRVSGDPLSVALVQGNISQALKWEPEQLTPSLVLYAQQSKPHFGRDLIVWPETAISAFQFQVDEAFLQPLETQLKRHASHLVFGVVRLDAEQKHYFNAMVALGNEQRDSYFKRHLVPFTEYLPFKSLLQPLVQIFTIPMSDFSRGRAVKPLMQVGPHQAGLSICYEDAFGVEMSQALPEAAYLINASNDAWFGRSLAPPQHLQIARMRALEMGRYLLRATNTGISAIIGPKGELKATAPLQEMAVVTGQILPMRGITPFARFGNWPLMGMLFLSLTVAFFLGHVRFRSERRVPGQGIR